MGKAKGKKYGLLCSALRQGMLALGAILLIGLFASCGHIPLDDSKDSSIKGVVVDEHGPVASATVRIQPSLPLGSSPPLPIHPHLLRLRLRPHRRPGSPPPLLHPPHHPSTTPRPRPDRLLSLRRRPACLAHPSPFLIR